jgi:hypothetical protein
MALLLATYTAVRGVTIENPMLETDADMPVGFSAFVQHRHVSCNRLSQISPSAGLSLTGYHRYEQTIISIMSLPISTTATTCIILLPVLAFLNTLFCTARSRPAHPASRQFAQYLLPPTLQILQTIITTILGTIFLSDVIPSAARQCLLSSRWQDLWVAHNSAAIRRIQDTHNCCGFNSVKDRAWPFPTGDKTEPGCATQFGRTTACATPWTKAMRTAAGVEFGVVLGVGALQVSFSMSPRPCFMPIVEILMDCEYKLRGRQYRYSTSSSSDVAVHSRDGVAASLAGCPLSSSG